ncbi:DUF2057 family protein [Ferrimonas pelagia]|uniref:DUF2057 domain-containing protein n=1 Tax=Ferrimonas pelagia TaxID=1177826 RepID=A0ABP9F5Z8_9GAMM
MKQCIAVTLFLASFNLTAGDLILADNIEILTLNGVQVESYDERLPIDHGTQVLTIRYDELFIPSTEYHQFVRSGVQVIRFEALETKDYFLSTPAMTLEQAVDFAKDPEFFLTTEHDQMIDHQAWSRDELLTYLLNRN